MRKHYTLAIQVTTLFLFFLLNKPVLHATDLNENALAVFCTPINPAATPDTNSGSVQISISGATAPFEFILINAFDEIIQEQIFNQTSINFNLTGLAAGSYFLQVNDANNEEATCDFTITLATCRMTVMIEDVALSCQAETADLTVIAENGVAPYSYRWETGSTEATISNLGIGTYRVTVTDDANCTTVVEGEVLGNVPIFVAATATQAATTTSSDDGRIQVNINGGTALYDYIILGLNGVEIQSGNTQNLGNNFSLNGFAAGRYQVFLTDSEGCTAETDVVVPTANCNLNINITETSIDCFGALGQLEFDINGGVEPYTITWDNMVSTENTLNLAAGNYNFTITDWSACSMTISRTINEPTELYLECATTQNVSTTGGSNGEVGFYINGGTMPYHFDILDAAMSSVTSGDLPNVNSLDIGGLPAGDFTLIITDDANCNTTCNFSITEPICEMTVTIADDFVNCYEDLGDLAAVVTGGLPPYQYFWSNAVTQSSISNWPAGDYTVRVTDANGCQRIAQASIIQPDVLEITCQILHQGEASGEATGVVSSQIVGGTLPYTYFLNGEILGQSNGSILLENLVAQDYTLFVIDANDCTTDCSFNIFPCAVVLDYISQNVTCHGGNDGYISLNISGAEEPITYDWNGTTYDGFDELNNLSAGTYSVILTDANNCIRSQTISITEPPTNLELTCQVESQNLGQNRIHYTINGLHPPYQVNIDGADFFATATQTNNGTFQVEIPNGNPVIMIEVIDDLGCSANCEVNLGAANCATFSALAYLDGVGQCNIENAAAAVFVEGGTWPYAYVWSNGVMTNYNPDIQAATTYSVTVTDATGCLRVSDVFVPTATDLLSVSIASSNMLCENSTTTLSAQVTGGQAPYEYYWWTDGSDESSLEVTTEGRYKVTVIDQNGCVSQTEMEVSTGGFDIKIDDVFIGCHEEEGQAFVEILGGAAPYDYFWSNGSSEAAPFLSVGGHQVTISDATGCTGTSELAIFATEGTTTVSNCPTNFQITATENETLTPVFWMPPTVESDCDYTISADAEPGDLFPLGFSVVDYRVTDASGNMSACIFVIEVLPFDINHHQLETPRLNARKKEQTTILSWLLEEEQGILFYELEKSENPYDFEFFTKIDKKTNTGNTYLKIDEQPHARDNYYRLKVHYVDGHFAYSDLKVVNHQIKKNTLTIFPNPVQDELVVYLPVANQQQVSIQIYNCLGHLVEDLKVEMSPQQPIYINTSRFQNGLYTMITKVENRRMMVDRFVVEHMD